MTVVTTERAQASGARGSLMAMTMSPGLNALSAPGSGLWTTKSAPGAYAVGTVPNGTGVTSDVDAE